MPGCPPADRDPPRCDRHLGAVPRAGDLLAIPHRRDLPRPSRRRPAQPHRPLALSGRSRGPHRLRPPQPLPGTSEPSRLLTPAAQRGQHHLRELATTFDATVQVAKTPFFFSSDITPTARPIAIDGSQRLIDSGDHHEAVFWIIATFARCHTILAADAPNCTQPSRRHSRRPSPISASAPPVSSSTGPTR